jgi:uncharacterized cupredoxin-like copper-binding protein
MSVGNLTRIGLAIAAFGTSTALAQPVDWSAAQTVTIVTTEYHFTPDKLTFRRGVPYHLHLENPGKEMHEFTATDFFKTTRIRNPEVLATGVPEIVLQPTEQKDLYFVADKAGHYPLTCADHDWAGMIGEITVE